MNDTSESDSDNNNELKDAVTLYGLIHARFIITQKGLDLMVKYIVYYIV